MFVLLFLVLNLHFIWSNCHPVDGKWRSYLLFSATTSPPKNERSPRWLTPWAARGKQRRGDFGPMIEVSLDCVSSRQEGVRRGFSHLVVFFFFVAGHRRGNMIEDTDEG